jgi:hypothetical protein
LDELISTIRTTSDRGLGGSTPNNWGSSPLSTQRQELALATIRRAELKPSATVLTRANDQAIRRALEQAGVEFIDAERGGPGVRLRAPPAEN